MSIRLIEPDTSVVTEFPDNDFSVNLACVDGNIIVRVRFLPSPLLKKWNIKVDAMAMCKPILYILKQTDTATPIDFWSKENLSCLYSGYTGEINWNDCFLDDQTICDIRSVLRTYNLL